VSLATAQISNYTDENGNNKVIYGQDNRIEPYLVRRNYRGTSVFMRVLIMIYSFLGYTAR